MYFIEDFFYGRSCKNKTCYHRRTSYAIIKSLYGCSAILVLVKFVNGGLQVEENASFSLKKVQSLYFGYKEGKLEIIVCDIKG